MVGVSRMEPVLVVPEAIGGSLCLDFANTVGPRSPQGETTQRDYLPAYRDLLAWAADAGAVTEDERRRIASAAARSPERARAALRRAHRLREAVYDVFAALAEVRPVPKAGLTVLHRGHLEALRNAELSAGAGLKLDWVWRSETSLDRPVWPVARSAIELALSSGAGLIKSCPGDDGQCGWLFLDTSKNHSRRWCSMSTCGSKHKSRAQVDRLRAARTTR